ncbi:restriction endonuclease subunit S [Patescibacteria group bacterium]|nr:restriction endonuclease subunit S [Patescibacteria group bacterium]
MSQISKIKYSDILEAQRFDAEYFKPEYLKMYNLLKKKEHLLFEDVAFITDGIHSSIDFDDKSNILLFSAKAPKENFFDTSGLGFISKEQHNKNPRTALQAGDVIISTVGTIGNCATVTEDLLPANSDRHVGIIRPNSISSYFISTFLLSKYGRMQSQRNTVGNVQPNLYIKDMKGFIMPMFSGSFQVKVEKMVKNAHQKKNQSKKLYQEAEELLLSELGLLYYAPKQSLAFSATKKDVAEAERFDAEYFQPKYAEIIEKIEKYKGGYDTVANIFSRKKGVEVGSEAYVDKGKDFIRVSDFSEQGIENSGKKISEKVFEELREKHQPKKGEILYTKDGTIGRSYLVKDEINGILSGAFLRLNLKKEYKDFEKEALVLILNSVLCRSQVDQLSGGALIAHLKPSDFESFRIPLLSKSLQEKIARKITESHQLRKESRELLEKAKRMVEEEIEK